ncbi:hypothetical protein [Dactylosporangium sp. NPDC049140]|uniref:hypothetical protein n=1 Tax=Dactylosporangium sp. NPDC049140 TaxID=3155647 RepID=UPI0033E1B639
MEAWPFLVGRGRTTTSRTIVAPAFLVPDGRYRDLVPRPDDAAETPGGLLRRPYGATHTMFFRTVAATDDAGAALLDRVNRPITLAVGVLVDGERPDVDPDTFAAGERAALTVYRRFLLDGERHDLPIAAHALGTGAPAPAVDSGPAAGPPAVVPPRPVGEPGPGPGTDSDSGSGPGRRPGCSLWPVFIVLGVAVLVLLAGVLLVALG